MKARRTPKGRAVRAKKSPSWPSTRWLEQYGRTLTLAEITLVQAHRGLPPAVQRHLSEYASGLIMELASDGRVKSALRALLGSPALQDRPVPRGTKS